jgi:hypothetical protein
VTRIPDDLAQEVLEAVENGDPIPVAAFLASWAGDVATVTEPEGLAEMLHPRWRDRLLESGEFGLLRAAAEGWAERNHGVRRPELARKERSSKQVGSYLEGELREAIETGFGRELGGNAAEGVDIQGIRVDIKTTRITQPQSSAPVKSGAEPACGLDCHLLLLVYDLDEAGNPDAPKLQVASLTFIPRWMTTDHRVADRAEILRRKVLDGEVSAVAAATALTSEFPALDVTPELIELLSGTEPVPRGVTTVSPAFQWRYQYRAVHNEAAEAQGMYVPE